MRLSVILALALGVAAAAPSAARDWEAEERARYESCLARIAAEPDAAYEDALAWQFEGGGPPARHCIGSALVALGQIEEGAARLEAAALAADAGDASVRAGMLGQAGDAWLKKRDLDQAVRLFSLALGYAPGDVDLLKGRALAYGLTERHGAAEADLTIVLSQAPRDVEALRMRAHSLLAQNKLDEAGRDIEAALKLEPEDVDTLVMRGRLREAEAGRGVVASAP